MVSNADKKPTFAEFFCGGGMVHAGLYDGWTCAFANDIDPMKCDVYRANWGGAPLIEGDIAEVSAASFLHAGAVDLCWASSPCQDFSLAGKGLGLGGARSGVFSHWANLIGQAVLQGLGPRIVAFENVTGLMTRNDGRDMREVLATLAGHGYRLGALEIDGAHFVPQSRPRLFIVGIRDDIKTPALESKGPLGPFHTSKIVKFHASLPPKLRKAWVWWTHAADATEPPTLAEIIDDRPNTPWFASADVTRMLRMMSAPSQARVTAARLRDGVQIGMLYKRGRPDAAGLVRQRAEIRFDGLAGCLRTPSGGSSRQTVMFIDGKRTRARLLSSRETARLMGLDDSYRMPERYNAAYKVAGDGVCVPIIRYLDRTLFQPMLACSEQRQVA